MATCQSRSKNRSSTSSRPPSRADPDITVPALTDPPGPWLLSPLVLNPRGDSGRPGHVCAGCCMYAKVRTSVAGSVFSVCVCVCG